jgi:hypothetical protein
MRAVACFRLWSENSRVMMGHERPDDLLIVVHLLDGGTHPGDHYEFAHLRFFLEMVEVIRIVDKETIVELVACKCLLYP